MSSQDLIDVYSTALDILLETFFSFFKVVIKNIPGFLPTIAIFVALGLLKHLTKPKYDGPVFDDDYANDFDFAYDKLRRYYDSDRDFINDYMSDFTAFADDDPELDELVEYDMWDNISYDRYIDEETAFIEESEDNYSYSFEEFEGSYYDYVDSSEE